MTSFNFMGTHSPISICGIHLAKWYTERIPVSELEQVKVEVIGEKTTDARQPDENGFCTWNFTLEPYSQLEASLVFAISAAPEVQGL